MDVGTLLADRFEIERRVAAGGLSSVYRATDRRTGQPVAVKVLHGDEAGEHADRFRREARILEELRYPGVVRHVAHGNLEAEGGPAFIAMEWLEGETVSKRLASTGLTMTESVLLAAKVAETLAFTHARGILHRDIKPANLLLVGGEIERVKLIDFGIARPLSGTEITGAGVLLGTLGYMAPEQARGSSALDGRCDIFALGSVLYKCLTGIPPFAGEDAIGILAKMLFEKPPSLRDARKDVPAALSDLVSRMLARDPAERPADAGVVAAELQAIAPLTTQAAAPRDRSTHADVLTRGEQRLVSVVAAAAHAHLEEEMTIVDGTWQGMKTLGGRLRATLGPFGAHLETLASGMLVVTFSGQKSATDQAIRAARCVLAMRRAAPQVPMVLATGRAILDERLPQGDAVDRAVAMLRAHVDVDADAVGAGRPQPIHLDEVTAGLLDARFLVRAEPLGLELVGEREAAYGGRTLLGRATACVGRDRELVQLEGVFAECVSDDVARAVLVTAPAGVGKSRLRYELVRMLRHRGDPLEVWIARGDPMRAGSPFGMLSQIVRQAAGVLDGEPVKVQREKIRARVSRVVPSADRARVAGFLAEMIGATAEEGDADVQLRAARQDASLMGDQMRRALEDWVRGECAHRPVVIVFEDLHWGDLPSVKGADVLLRALANRPLFVLALARPEITELFPDLWSERALIHVRLAELSRKAAEKLTRQVLGDQVDEALVTNIVERAGGNAFYLEELIRGVAEGRGDALPETVLSMVEARLLSLEPEARRVLRAASVFGETFWRGGVAALLGAAEASSVSTWLDELGERELVMRRDASRFRGEEELVFRHAMVREAAYGMLKDRDRALGHRLAAEWLQRVGEREAIVLAEHFERAEEPARAISFYRRAAAQALEGNDLEAALRSAERGIACGAKGEVYGRLRLRQAEAHRWRGEVADAERAARDAMQTLPRGTKRWFLAVGEAVEASGRLGNAQSLHQSVDDLCDVSSTGEPSAAHLVALTRAAVVLLQGGNYPGADDLMQFIERAAARLTQDPFAMGHVFRVRAYRTLVAGDPADSLSLFEQAIESLERAGDVRAACRHRTSCGAVHLELGDYEHAVEVLRRALVDSDKMGLTAVTAGAWHNLGMALARVGLHDEGLREETRAVASFAAQGDRRMEGASRLYCAFIRLMAGHAREAEEDARRAAEVAAFVPAVRAVAEAVVARAMLLAQRPEEAEAPALEAMQTLESLGALEEGESFVRLVHVEALDANGRHEDAVVALEMARDRLLARADRIRDDRWRKRFLAIEENARTLQLVDEWL